MLRHTPGQIEIIAVLGGRLADYALWRPGAPDGWGDLYRGRIAGRVASLGGVFVALGTAGDGFLPDREMRSRGAEGDPVLVQVTRAAQGGKGPRLTALLDETVEAGDTGLVRRGPSPLDEIGRRHPDLPVLTAVASVAADLASAGVRLSAEAASLEDAVADDLDGLRTASLALPGGARATLTPTPALVAIDVDTAAATAGRKARQSAQFAVNRALVPRLLHEVRLRNLSGAILIDFAGLHANKRALLRPTVEAALDADPLRPRLIGFTGLGLAEIVRARRRPPLHEQWGGAGEAYEAAAALARAAAGRPGGRLALRARPSLAGALGADAAIGRDLARATGHPLIVRPDPSLSNGWTVEEVTS